MATLMTEKVTHVHHWNDTLFSFKTTRDMGFKFENGHFTMIGLKQDGRPLLRAYSIVSANYEEELEFLLRFRSFACFRDCVVVRRSDNKTSTRGKDSIPKG